MSTETARNNLRDCFLSDSRDRFGASADAYRDAVYAETVTKMADLLETLGMDDASAQLRYQATPYTDDTVNGVVA